MSKEERLAKEDILFLFRAAEQPNFVGRCVVIQWPCGTECTRMAVADAVTGSVYPPPLNDSRWVALFQLQGRTMLILPITAKKSTVTTD